MKRGLLIIMSGPSGVGKGTVRRLVMADKSLNLAYSVSMTTRPRREHETPGVDYFYVTKEEFQKTLDEDGFLEHAQFVGNYYGTPKAYVEKLRNEGKNVLLEIEVEGAKQVISKCHGSDVVTIFLIPPSMEDLEQRIRKRGTESEEVIQQRLAKAQRELELKYAYDYPVINDTVKSAADQIRKIIRDKIKYLGLNQNNKSKGE
ncbi:MAG TPA: guanylate kinase [Firmicutes bacterium]|jgi:guanylate kinase|nr:guanylate kinase [Clostridium sp. CAG:288]HAR47842.1 guanylate kinase [Bacillota bacterium]HAX00750.1 guanylate kinase [Bacillota bacterium]